MKLNVLNTHSTLTFLIDTGAGVSLCNEGLLPKCYEDLDQCCCLTVYIKKYSLPQTQTEEINNQVKGLLKQNIIEPSISPYKAPLLLVPKKGTKRSEDMEISR